MRFSRAGKLSRGRPPDFLEEIVNSDLVISLESKLAGMQASETDAGPDTALAAISQLLGEEERENRIVYLVSDFRSRDWAEAVALQKELSRLNDLGVQVRLIQCVDTARPNLALRALTPLPGTPPFVRGIVNLRGRILPVYDVKKFFALPEQGLGDLHRIIVVQGSDFEIGLLADVVSGVMRLRRSALSPPLPTLSAIAAEYLLGVSEERLVVLDLDRLLSDPAIVVNDGENE